MSKQKVQFPAADPKKGITLEELQSFANRAVGLAEVNGTTLDDCKVTVLINWSGGIKQLTVEV